MNRDQTDPPNDDGLTLGAVLFRVDESYDEDAWQIVDRLVVKLGPKTFKLNHGFVGVGASYGVLWRAPARNALLGRLFFLSPAEAVADFARRQRERVAAAHREFADGTAAIKWAAAWKANP